MRQSKMFDPPAPSDHLPRDAPTLRGMPVCYVLVLLGAAMALGLGEFKSHAAGRGRVFAWERGLGHRTMLEVWV
jgi:hypothetical protein